MCRLSTIAYDLLLLLALLFIVTALENFVFNHGNAIVRSNPYYWLYFSSLVLIIFLLRLVLDTRWTNAGD